MLASQNNLCIQGLIGLGPANSISQEVLGEKAASDRATPRVVPSWTARAQLKADVEER